MPLTEDAGGKACIAEIVGDGWDFGTKEGPSAAHVDGPVTGGVHPGKELPAGGRAHRGDMIIGQTDALAMKTVQVWGLQDRVPVNGEFRVALVVGHDDQYVRMPFKREAQTKKR